MDEPPPRQPLQCLQCEYPLGGIEANACPECGADIAAQAPLRAIIESKRADAERLRKLARRLAFIVPGVYGVSAMVLTAEPVPMLVGTVLLQLFALVSLVPGWYGLRFLDPPMRSFMRESWSRQLLFMHMPWLIMPVCAVTIMLVAFTARASGNDESAVLSVALVGLVFWLMLVFSSLAMGLANLFDEASPDETATTALGSAFYMVSFFAVIGIACVFGLVGGIMSVYSSLRIFFPEVVGP